MFLLLIVPMLFKHKWPWCNVICHISLLTWVSTMVGAKGKDFLFKGAQCRGSDKTCTFIPFSLCFETMWPMDLWFYGSMKEIESLSLFSCNKKISMVTFLVLHCGILNICNMSFSRIRLKRLYLTYLVLMH